MRAQPKRANFIKLMGKEVLASLPTYEFDNSKGSDISVTAARKIIRNKKLDYNIVIKIQRDTGTIDRFYWCERGLFSADYAEANYINFLELRKISMEIAARDTVYLLMDRQSHLEIEEFKYEYRY